MNPTAFQIGSFEIRWYGILIGAGVILAILLASYNCKKKDINFDIILDGFFIAFPAAIIGARAYYVIFEFQNYKDNLIDVINIRKGGLAIHGGLIGAFIAVYFFTKIKKLDILKCLDIVAPSIILAQAIGRWGNFMNGEAHGGEVSYEFISHFPSFIQKGMYIGGAYYNPTFLYESIWNLIVCSILLIILHKKSNRNDGIVIASYISLYSVGRFFIEGLRTDSLMLGNIRVAQLISIIGILAGLAFLVFIKRKHRNS
ncbi:MULTISPECIES: prolipoprotein diacylglyceryl transferase [unclassified Clostridium]|uniref:prolipoprotein diacylglyceryl transferase n=1 Tax=unclassified Clostridium TaxID=2614128 RepID=UPI0002981280|nr:MULTISPECIES: prolipoprotein diacylglyceryl transferase [unclassified Clostridium]EKQ57995.1 MAG: prolipoprotein diacylglyceryl transferase [Clostridium sp. Maddingley MBC34-26]